MASVRLDNITRRYGKVNAIQNISFLVPDGEFWVMVGPSGCGKSTILRTIAGLDTATSGDLWIGSQRVNHLPARQRDVAMVFQNYALYPHMSVAENLGFGLRMRNVDPEIQRDRIQTVAKTLNISHLLNRKPRQLSGGQQQRVALGRAIAREPQVFLLDEPLSNLDAQLRDDTRAELKQLHQQVGITTLYVTHDQVEAMTLADQIVVLDQGTIQQIGTPQDIYNAPANRMVATFMGNPPMNVLRVHCCGEQLSLNKGHIPCPANLSLHPDQEYDLGIRPEWLQIVGDDPSAHLQGRIQVIEPLGREVLVRIDVAGQVVQLLTSPQQSLGYGDHVGLRFNLDHVYVFDVDTGQRLFPSPN